jgi:hypothetical protein
MSIWCSIPGTSALHYEGSHVDPRTAQQFNGVFGDDNPSADEVDLAVVPDYVFDHDANGETYLPYLRLGLIVDNAAAGDVILNRNQVKKLTKELKKFLKNTKKKKENTEEVKPEEIKEEDQ